MKKKKLKKLINKLIDKRIDDILGALKMEYALRNAIEQFKSAKIPNTIIGNLFGQDNKKS